MTEKALWIDNEQMDSFMHEYDHCSNKEQFLRDKQRQNAAVRQVHLIFSSPSSVPLIGF